MRLPVGERGEPSEDAPCPDQLLRRLLPLPPPLRDQLLLRDDPLPLRGEPPPLRDQLLLRDDDPLPLRGEPLLRDEPLRDQLLLRDEPLLPLRGDPLPLRDQLLLLRDEPLALLRLGEARRGDAKGDEDAEDDEGEPSDGRLGACARCAAARSACSICDPMRIVCCHAGRWPSLAWSLASSLSRFFDWYCARLFCRGSATRRWYRNHQKRWSSTSMMLISSSQLVSGSKSNAGAVGSVRCTRKRGL